MEPFALTGHGRNLFHAAVGVAAGVAGVAASRCTGGSCSTCLACAIPGVSVLLLGVWGKLSHRVNRVPQADRDRGHDLFHPGQACGNGS